MVLPLQTIKEYSKRYSGDLPNVLGISKPPALLFALSPEADEWTTVPLPSDLWVGLAQE